MSLKTCTVQFSKRNDSTILVSKPLAAHLQLKRGKPLQLKVGSRSISAPFKILNRTGNQLHLPLPLKQQMNHVQPGSYLLVSSRTNEVRLGPVIGILTSGTITSASQPFGGRTSFIKQLLRAGVKRGICYAFRPSDINWQDESIVAYILTSTGSLTRKRMPLPDVVYNRLASRSAEKSGSMRELKERFARRSIPLFNWSFFDKSDVYALLDGETEAEKHVPETINNPNAEQIRDLLKKHQFVYLKPTGGSLGIGIYRLTYQPKKGWFARFRRDGKNVLMKFDRFASLARMLQSGGRLRNAVVQQGIRLVEIDGCPLDFRFHLHKNNQNEWVVVGIGAKRAGRGSVTTHIRTGGQLMTPEQALNQVYGSEEKADDILAKAKRDTIKLAEAIERNYEHPIGELGFDIGIDTSGNIWMFEANAKPGRSIYKHPSLKSEGADSIRHIIEYCTYLAKFRRRREG